MATELNLSELKKKAEAATPGPWFPFCDHQFDLQWLGNDKMFASVVTKRIVDGREYSDVHIVYAEIGDDDDGKPSKQDIAEVSGNINFIAACDPTTILALIARVEELERREPKPLRTLNDIANQITGNDAGRK